MQSRGSELGSVGLVETQLFSITPNVSVPAQVLADAHTQILRCIHRFQFLVMHEVTGHDRIF